MKISDDDVLATLSATALGAMLATGISLVAGLESGVIVGWAFIGAAAGFCCAAIVIAVAKDCSGKD